MPLTSYPRHCAGASPRPRPRRCVITPSSVPQQHAGLATDFADSYAFEDDVLAAARRQALELGVTCVTPAAGAALRFIAAASNARAVVEVGTGTGVSGVWLLRGTRPGGVLTTIDIEAEHQRVARRLFVEAGFPASRTRIISGRALDVLPRLADGVYDLVFVDHDAAEYAAAVTAAARLLRPGGILVLGAAFADGRVTDVSVRDVETVSLREVLRELRETDEWTTALLPVGSGLLGAVRRD
jgi:predicted O-methyltransferase YrrM